jgi:ATP-dependent helicase YprA (DUF1998 family)
VTPNIPRAVRDLVGEYRRFLRTSYRFLDPDLRKQFEAHLSQAEVVVRGPYVTLARDFVRGATLSQLVGEGRAEKALLKANWPFGSTTLFLHQEQAFTAGREGRSFVVTTGTGSGKTEAFLLPILDGILRRKQEGRSGLQAVLLYPMNALANDQLERLRRLLRGTGLDLSFALYTGDSEASSRNLREAPAEGERLTRQATRRDPPDVLLTNYKQLEFLLVRPEDRILFTDSLRYLVLDEIHSYRGALATEIACLIRRLKAHARLRPGELVGIGTSATVASSDEGATGLAAFATALFGEEVREGDVIRESLAEIPDAAEAWAPPAPDLSEERLASFDPENVEMVVSLAETLTGRSAPPSGPVARRVAAILGGNSLVTQLERIFSEPRSLSQAVELVREQFPGRGNQTDEAVRREIEAYLLAGSVGDEAEPPRLRPKLHTFFHGIYDVALCLNPGCRTLVPQGGAECLKCGSAARPAALCRTCGQDFVKLRREREGDDKPVGTGDFFSDERTSFMTHKVWELPEGAGEDDEEEPENQVEEGPAKKPARKGREREDRLRPTGVCVQCGRLLDEGAICCGRPAVRMLIHDGKLNTCPACGDIYTRGDIVTPLRTGTASTVSVLTTHHLDPLAGEDRKLLVFADNRQDVAHQAGYTADKHRAFALRHAISSEVAGAAQPVYLQELPQRLFDAYRTMGIVLRKPTGLERQQWLKAIAYEAASEFTRFSRQRASLENLGLVAVDYEFLNDLTSDPRFQALAAAAPLDPLGAASLVRALLDIMRKNRAVAYDFFQQYVDPDKRPYRELAAEPFNVRFPERERTPQAFAVDRPDHVRKDGRVKGFFQENPSAGGLPATQKLVVRLLGRRAAAEDFLRKLVPLLEEHELLVNVPTFPLPKNAKVPGMRLLQVDPRVIRLSEPPGGYRCNACQVWRAYMLPTCPTPRCASGKLQPTLVDEDNYYVRLYRNRKPRRLAVAEHTAQVDGEERARRETSFKEGWLDVLVCSPTLELGVDIGPLLTVVLRNAPPTPANYAQRVGRAGRRLRIGFVSTFCAGSAHDRQAFENPAWLVSGRFEPPRVRLDNPKVVRRHLNSHLLESVDHQLPRLMGQLLDDLRTPTRWSPEAMDGLFQEVKAKQEPLVLRLSALLEEDRKAGRTERFGPDEVGLLVEGFQAELTSVVEGWWKRVEQLDREFREYSTVGSPRQDDRKAAARKRAYYEITQDPQQAYALNYLSTRGLLPAYQFPLDTFSLDPGVEDTPTLYRPASIAIEEFAPGNFVYANGHKLRSIRVLFPGGPGTAGGRPGRTDAETSGRLQAFHFCSACEHAVEAPRNECPRCGAPLDASVPAVFVDAFEAEENLRIGSDEESRQRQFHVRRENLLVTPGRQARLYRYPLLPLEHLRLAEVLVTNWGRAESKTAEGRRFWLCPDCGRHLPYDRDDAVHARQVQSWQDQHARYCKGELAQLVLAYRFETDCLLLNLPGRSDAVALGRSAASPTTVTFAQALVEGASGLLELEPNEIAAFPLKTLVGKNADQIVFYETVPGGAGYVEEMARRLPEVAQMAMARLYGHSCSKACYLCLKHYGNQRWHAVLDKDRVRDLLLMVSQQERVEPEDATTGSGMSALETMMIERQREATEGAAMDPHTGTYRKGFIEEPLGEALSRIADLPAANRELEIKDGDRVITVPDFAWEDVKLAVYCDGFAVHGNVGALTLDAAKRNTLQSRGWVVLTYWGRTILKDAAACARQIGDVYRHRSAWNR